MKRYRLYRARAWAAIYRARLLEGKERAAAIRTALYWRREAARVAI